MAERTGIEWTDSTWNPIAGTAGRWHCVKVSEACRNCYAETFNKRFGGPAYKVGADDVRLNMNTLADPLRYEGHVRRGVKQPGHRVFPCSMTDLHGEFVPMELRAAVYGVMSLAPSLIFQVLTKRPAERMRFRRWVLANATRMGVSSLDFVRLMMVQASPGLRSRLKDAAPTQWPLPNVWEGVTVECDAEADRIEELPDAAPVRIISAEPLLGPLTLPDYVRGERWWVIAGGESGDAARPMHPEWLCSLRDQCLAAGVPFFFKQWGAWGPSAHGTGKAPSWMSEDGELTAVRSRVGSCTMFRLGKRRTGAQLEGLEWKQIPAVFPDGSAVPY